GTTTATVLAEAIYVEGLKNVIAGANPVRIKRGAERAVEAVVKAIDELAVPIKGKNDIEQIATISANGDSAIGKMISEAFEKVGRDGVITVEEGKSLASELDVVEGMQFHRGYLSTHFITNQDAMTVEMEKPLIL